MKRIVLATFFITPLLWSCQSNSAKFDTAWGVIDAREFAKKCVDLQKNNPTKFEINARYQMLCRDPKVVYEFCSGCDGEQVTKVVYGYMNLHKDGVDISAISPEQASGDKPLDLASTEKPNDTDCDADCWKRRDEASFASMRENAKRQESRLATAETYCWFSDTERVCIEKQNLSCETNRSGSIHCSAKGEWSGKDPIDTKYYVFDSWKTNDEISDTLFNSMLCFHKGRLTNDDGPTCSAARHYGLI